MELSYRAAEEKSHVTHEFSWKIPNFFDAIKQTREFRTVKMSDSRPQLRLQVLGYDKDTIELSCLSPASVVMNDKVRLNAYNGIQAIAESALSFVNKNKWHHLATLHKRDIVNDLYSYLQIATCISFDVNLKFIRNITDEHANVNHFSNNLQDALKTSLLSDAVIKSKEGKEFKVHKLILASRSVVFKTRFERWDADSQTNTNIVESPFDAEVLEEVLSYIYSGQVRLKDFPQELLKAADFYALNGLKTMCEEELSLELTEKNFIEMLELAKTYQAEVLKQSIVDRMKKLTFLEDHEDGTDWTIQDCAYDNEN